MGDYLRIVFRRVRSGESGALPVIIGLVAVVIFFQVRNSLFLSAANLVNLLEQSAFIITLGMAEIFVLLLGDIDLAAGFTAACGAVVALWMLALGDPWWAAVLVSLAACALYGALQGIIVARLRLPSFVVTLAGQLGLSGVLLYLVGQTGNIGVGGVISLHSTVINDIESRLAQRDRHLDRDDRHRGGGRRLPVLRRLPPPLGRPGRPAGVGLAAQGRRGPRRRPHRGGDREPEPRPPSSSSRACPGAVLVVLAILFVWTILLGRTRFGRYIYAIGGNAEAARRAGINVVRVRTLAFMLCGLTAGMTGIIYASYLGSISTDVDGGQNVLNAVAAAVIGGTSLFGGRGKMFHAVIGGLVVGVIYNGLELLGLSASAQLIWTALVLLAAVIVDRVTRRGSNA